MDRVTNLRPRLTVLHVIDRLDDEAVGTVLGALLAELSSQGLARNIVVATAPYDDDDPAAARLRDHVDEIVPLRRRHGYDPRTAAAIAAAGRRHGIDLIHSHDGATHLHASGAALLLRRPHVSSVNTPGPGGRGTRRSLSDALTAVAARRIVAPCSQVADAYAQANHVAPSRLRVVASAAAAPVGSPPERLAALRAELLRGRERPLVLSVAALEQSKGGADLIRAARLLVDRGIAATFAIAGEGPERERLTALVAELGLEDSVQLLGARGDCGSLLEIADVYCLPSHTEGVPAILLEALAAGLPSVATRVGGVPDLIAHGHSGLLVDPAEPQSLARALARVLQHPAFAEHLSRGALEVARAHSPRACARGYAELYRELTAA